MKRIVNPISLWLIIFIVLFFVLLSALASVLTPFIIAAVLAYILNPWVDRLCQKSWKRERAALLVMLLTCLVLALLVLIFLPFLFNQILLLIQKIPQLLDYIPNSVMVSLEKYFDVNLGQKADWIALLREHIDAIKQTSIHVLNNVVQQGNALIAWVANILLLPLLLYYFLLDWNMWKQGVQKSIPRRFFPTYHRISTEIDNVLSAFLRGQLMVMVLMALFYGIALELVGLETGFAIGILAGLLVFIPYLGAFGGLLLGTLTALLQFQSWQDLLWVWGVFAAGQLLESFVLTPKIVGNQIGLSPFWVIFSLMAFGQLFGFVGVLLGLPLAAIGLVLIKESTRYYFNSSFYQKEP